MKNIIFNSGLISILVLICYHAAAFVFILLFQYLFSDLLKKATDKALHHTLRSALLGMGFFIMIPGTIALMMASLFGFPLAVLLLGIYVSVVLLVNFIVAVSVANWLNGLVGQKWGLWMLALVALFIYLALNLLLMIRVAGWIILTLTSSIAIGGLLATVTWRPEGQISNFSKPEADDNK